MIKSKVFQVEGRLESSYQKCSKWRVDFNYHIKGVPNGG